MSSLSHSFQVAFAVLALFLAASCTQSRIGKEAVFSSAQTCSVYEGEGETTEYSAWLSVEASGDAVVHSSSGRVFLNIQGFHPNETSAQRIVEVRLSDSIRLTPQLLSNECVCGVRIRQSDSMCAHLSTYKALLEQVWLEDAQRIGLIIQFKLENGIIAEGPRLPPKEIRKFLSSLNAHAG